MAKKNQGSGKDVMVFIVIVGAIFMAYLLFFGGNPDNPQGVDIGSEVPAYVDENGYCIGREGIEMGVCCAVWDAELKEEVWVLCETLVNNKADVSQAFFRFEGGDLMEAVSSIMFVTRLTNNGNFDTEVKISSVDVVSITGGDLSSRGEIKSAFNSLTSIWNPVIAGEYTEFQMNWDDRIRLDVPGGLDEFTMEDGTYEVTLNIQSKDENGNVVDAGTRTISLEVEQEVISFSIDIATI